MRGRCAVVATLLVSWLALPAAAADAERTVPDRAFDGFELESKTVDGFWGELGALYQRTDTSNPDRIGVAGKLTDNTETAFARAAYGQGNKWEGDLFIPYINREGSLTAGGFKNDLGNNGIGDITLSGKYIPIRSDTLDLGAGALLSLPSGDDNKGLGTGEFGAMPFITSSFNLAIVEARGHFGGEFFTGSNDTGLAYNRVVYGGGLFTPIGKYVFFRNEFDGATLYDAPNSPRSVSYFPGLDLRIPIGELDLVLRVTGAIGLSDQAPDWGAGGSFVITSPTYRAPMAKGGVVVE